MPICWVEGSRPGLANLPEGTCPNCPYISILAHGNFEEQNQILESFIIIISYCNIIIDVYYNYTINVQ